MRRFSILIAMLVIADICWMCKKSAGDENAARLAWAATDQLLESIEVLGTWSQDGDGVVEQGTFRLLNHPGKFFLRIICERSQHGPHGDSRAGDMVIMLNDGDSFAVNRFGTLAGDRDCLLKVKEPRTEHYVDQLDFFNEDLSSVSRLVNPMPIRENLGKVEAVGDEFIATYQYSEVYQRRVGFSEASGFNFQWGELFNIRDQVVDGRTEVQWINKDDHWLPTSFRTTQRRGDERPAVHEIRFVTINPDYVETETDYLFSALEPCEKGVLVDYRDRSERAIYPLPSDSASVPVGDATDTQKKNIGMRAPKPPVEQSSIRSYLLLSFGILAMIAGSILWFYKR